MYRKRLFTSRSFAPPKRYLFLMTSVIFILLIFISFYIIDQKIRPSIVDIAEQKTIEFATRTINSAVKSTENVSFDDLVIMQLDNNGNVTTLGWNSEAVNRALRTATDRAEYFLYGMNKGQQIDVDDPELHEIEFGDTVGDLAAKDPTVIEIPLGRVTGNTLLSNLGPKVPVHFEIVGSLRSDVVHELKEFGVNAALFEIYIPVEVNIQIIIPFSTTTAEVSTKVFIDSRVIMGKVPEFFSAGGDNGPAITIPRENIGK